MNNCLFRAGSVPLPLILPWVVARQLVISQVERSYMGNTLLGRFTSL